MLNYQIILENPSLGTIFPLVLRSYSLTERLNTAPTGTFTLSFEEMNELARFYGTTVNDLFTAGKRGMYVYRNNVKILDSFIDDIEIQPLGNGEKQVTIKTVGLFGLLHKRIIGRPVRRFVATDAGMMAWTAIDETQDDDPPYSDLGITMGTITPSKDRDRSVYFEYVDDFITSLSNENLKNGFDFEIDNSRALNVYYPKKGENKPKLIFDETQNMAGWKWKKRIGRGITNRVFVTGEGQNEDILYTQRDADNSYKEPYGLMESKSAESSVSELDTLEDKGDRILEDLQQSSVIVPTITHYDSVVGWDEYALGDSVPVTIKDLQLNKTYKRVISRTLTVSDKSGAGVINVEVE